MGQLRGAEAMGGRRGTPAPNAPLQRPGKGRAAACVSPCARRGGWGSAGVVLVSAWSQPALSLLFMRPCGSGQPPPGSELTAETQGQARGFRCPRARVQGSGPRSQPDAQHRGRIGLEDRTGIASCWAIQTIGEMRHQMGLPLRTMSTPSADRDPVPARPATTPRPAPASARR
jgi:hypothetical protein